MPHLRRRPGRRAAPERPLTDPRYLTPDEVADILRCQPEKVYRLCGTRDLASFKVGGRRLIAKSDLDAFIENARGRNVATVTPIGSRR